MRMLLTAFCAALFFGICTEQGLAWKPYTHNTTADAAYNDVVADGKVTIAGQEFPSGRRSWTRCVTTPRTTTPASSAPTAFRTSPSARP